MTAALVLEAYRDRARHWRRAARNWEKAGNAPAVGECLQQAAQFERLAAAVEAGLGARQSASRTGRAPQRPHAAKPAARRSRSAAG